MTPSVPATCLRSLRLGPSKISRTTARYLSSDVLSEFRTLGLAEPLQATLQKSHPHVLTPSPCQASLIPAILSSGDDVLTRDVMLKSGTGTGK